MSTNIAPQASVLQKFQALFVSLLIGLVGLAIGGLIGHLIVLFAILLRVSSEPVPETKERSALPLREKSRGYVISSASLVRA